MIAAPFDGPWQSAVDVARIALFIGGMLLVGGMVLAAMDGERVRDTGRRYGAAAAAVALLVLAGSRIQNLGEPISWQFLASIVAYALFTFSFRAYRRQDAKGDHA